MVVSFHWIRLQVIDKHAPLVHYPPHGGEDGEDGTLWHVATLLSSKIGIQELMSIDHNETKTNVVESANFFCPRLWKRILSISFQMSGVCSFKYYVITKKD